MYKSYRREELRREAIHRNLFYTLVIVDTVALSYVAANVLLLVFGVA